MNYCLAEEFIIVAVNECNFFIKQHILSNLPLPCFVKAASKHFYCEFTTVLVVLLF